MIIEYIINNPEKSLVRRLLDINEYITSNSNTFYIKNNSSEVIKARISQKYSENGRIIINTFQSIDINSVMDITIQFGNELITLKKESLNIDDNDISFDPSELMAYKYCDTHIKSVGDFIGSNINSDINILFPMTIIEIAGVYIFAEINNSDDYSLISSNENFTGDLISSITETGTKGVEINIISSKIKNGRMYSLLKIEDSESMIKYRFIKNKETNFFRDNK
jgi:hypothetical protein